MRHDEAHHIGDLRTERHADADLGRALADGIGDDTVDADDRDDEREQRETRRLGQGASAFRDIGPWFVNLG